MKYILIGRSGTGKSELAKHLESKGLKILKTYTTRTPRSEEDAEKYHFISKDDVSKYTDRILETDFFGNTYFTTKQDIAAADVMILDPAGFHEIAQLFPNVVFNILYIRANLELADERAIARADDKDTERASIEKRRAGEDEKFGPLEQQLDNDCEGLDYRNCYFSVFENDFQIQTLNEIAANMTARLRMHSNFLRVLYQLAALEAIETDEVNQIYVQFEDGGRKISLDEFAATFIDNDQVFSQCIRSWMTHEISFKIPGELAPDALFKSEVPAE